MPYNLNSFCKKYLDYKNKGNTPYIPYIYV